MDQSRRSFVRSWWLKFAFPTFLPARARGSILARALKGCGGSSWQDASGNEAQRGRGTRQGRQERQSVACHARPAILYRCLEWRPATGRPSRIFQDDARRRRNVRLGSVSFETRLISVRRQLARGDEAGNARLALVKVESGLDGQGRRAAGVGSGAVHPSSPCT